MSNSISVPTPENFIFRHAVGGHGWYDLAPFVYDEGSGRLDYVYFSLSAQRPEPISISAGPGSLEVKLASKKTDKEEAARVVRHILRLDEDLEDFYSTVGGHEHFNWVG